MKKSTRQLPFVILKMAQTLDGKTATASGQSKWITSEPARREVQRLRGEVDAVLVGKNTVIEDDPRLDIRIAANKKKGGICWRVILDARGEVKPGARVFKGKQPVIRVVAKNLLNRTPAPRNLRPKSEILLPVRVDRKERLNLKEALEGLYLLGVRRVLVEGGSETAWSFLKGGFVNRVVWFIAPKILGGKRALPSVGGEGFSGLDDAIILKRLSVKKIGPDWMVEGDL